MIHKIQNILLIIALSVFAFSCTERVDIDLDQQKYARLVVEGEFSSDTMVHKVQLTKTEDYFSNMPPQPVTNAQVIIYNESEEYILSEIPANSGVYLTEPEVYGEVGKSYSLRIQLEEEIGGTRDYLATSTIYPVSQLDSIALEFHEDWGAEGYWEVQCYVLDPPTVDFYMFHVYRNGVLVNDTIDEVMVVDDELYNGNYTNGIGVAYLSQANDKEKLFPGDVVTLRLSRITEEYADFIWQLQEQVSYQTPLFSGSPANVQGNVSNGGFGAFGAYSSSYASQVTPVLK